MAELQQGILDGRANSACLLADIPETKPDSRAKRFNDIAFIAFESRPEAWSNWFSSYGFSYMEAPVMQFEQFYIMTQAAMTNLGVALLPKFLIQAELKKGDLIEVPIGEPPVNTLDKAELPAYYLIIPDDQQDHKPLNDFKLWLVDRCSHSSLGN